MNTGTSKVAKWVISIVIVLSLIAFLAIEGLYFHGLRVLPENTAPELITYPRDMINAQWVITEKESEIRLTPISPIEYFLTFIRAINQTKSNNKNIRFPVGLMLASQNARVLLRREENEEIHRHWHLNIVSATIWITNNWTAEQAIGNLLTTSYYGNGFFGIESASIGYFNKDYRNLDIYETSLLIGLQKGPSYFDPWCRPEKAIKRMNHVAKQLFSIWPSTYINISMQESLPHSLVNDGNRCKT